MRTILCALLAGAASLAQAAPLHRYTVTVDETLERLSVAACFDGPAPGMLVADDGASRFLAGIEVRGAPAARVEVGGREAAIAGAPDNACIDYRVALVPRTRGRQVGGPETRRFGGDLLTAFGDWLWRPRLSAGEDIELRFVLPPSVAVSAPWRRAGAGPAPVYRLAGTPPEWTGVVAFSRFPLTVFDIAGARVELAMVGIDYPAQQSFVRGWIERTARGVAAAGFGFPVDSLQVVVAPGGQRGRSPVPWAYVGRGGGPAVHVFADLTRAPQDIERDWSLSHEMAHLFLPYLESRDAWLFEGLPTYLQHVLMARSGMIAEEEAWRRMYEGFERAARVGEGLSLREASERNGRGGIYLRVYWGGAALMLAADLRLRALKPSQSLDAALAGLRACCDDGDRRYGAEEVLARMDAATGSTVFAEVAAQYLDSRAFPDYQRLFRALDIEMLGGHPILREGDSAPIRSRIMTKAMR